MGQNGAGKTTIFGLILGAGGHEEGYKPESGDIHVTNGATIATARQVIPREQLALTVREFFVACFKEKIYDIDPRIDSVLDAVNMKLRAGHAIGSLPKDDENLFKSKKSTKRTSV